MAKQVRPGWGNPETSPGHQGRECREVPIRVFHQGPRENSQQYRPDVWQQSTHFFSTACALDNQGRPCKGTLHGYSV